MARTTQSKTIAEKVSDMRLEIDMAEEIRKRDQAELRQSIRENTESINVLAGVVDKIAENINGFSMEMFSETLEKLVLLIDGDDSRDVTGLRKRMRGVEEVQATQNKSLARIEKKLSNLGILVIIASVLISIFGDGGATTLLELISKLFTP